MTDTQEAMRELMHEGWDAFVEEQKEVTGMSGLLPRPSYMRGWNDATTQSAEKIARLELDLHSMTTAAKCTQDACDELEYMLAAAELSNKQLRGALKCLVDSYTPLNIHAAQELFSQQPSTEAFKSAMEGK